MSFSGARLPALAVAVARAGPPSATPVEPAAEVAPEPPPSIAELCVLLAHELGHVLGLGHCFHCDSAMNYSWNTLGRVIVTEGDVRAGGLLRWSDLCQGFIVGPGGG